jgi:hypothetical protein
LVQGALVPGVHVSFHLHPHHLPRMHVEMPPHAPTLHGFVSPSLHCAGCGDGGDNGETGAGGRQEKIATARMMSASAAMKASGNGFSGNGFFFFTFTVSLVAQ